ncbi:MAG UNVERIFIED_CONTAM: formylglycine-generating enzyme family protein [Planctomycetaceae bacterium]|jgi:hypothetical protein
MGTNPSHFKGAQRPVESVSWEDCQRFIDALNSSLPDLRLALSTEAEWEYACRATRQTSTYIGDLTIDGKAHAKGLEDIAWYQANSEGETHPVGELLPNDFGLFDMLGNVWEWCRDNAYRKYEPDHVTDPVHRVGDSSAFRVFRGGCWVAPRSTCGGVPVWQPPWDPCLPPGLSLLQFREVIRERRTGRGREEPERSGRSRKNATRASGGCRSPGNGDARPRGQCGSRSAPGRYRPIDIDRTPSDIVQERIPSVFPACRASSISLA